MTSVLRLTGVLALPELLREGYKVQCSRKGQRLSIIDGSHRVVVDYYADVQTYRVIETRGKHWYDRRVVCDHSLHDEENVGSLVNAILGREAL